MCWNGPRRGTEGPSQCLRMAPKHSGGGLAFGKSQASPKTTGMVKITIFSIWCEVPDKKKEMDGNSQPSLRTPNPTRHIPLIRQRVIEVSEMCRVKTPGKNIGFRPPPPQHGTLLLKMKFVIPPQPGSLCMPDAGSARNNYGRFPICHW